MRSLATSSLLLLLLTQLTRLNAQELNLFLHVQSNQTLSLSVSAPEPTNGHTFIEFSTNGVWYPAFSMSSNVTGASFAVTNVGAVKIFRAIQAPIIANRVKASWQRLGITSYVFKYRQLCICGAYVSATVTVMNDQVVKVEDARDVFGNPYADPPIGYAPDFIKILDAWIAAEPKGGYARDLQFDANGFPLEINIDPDPRTADEELIYSIHDFTPLP